MRYSDVIILIQNHHRGNCPSRHRSPRHYATARFEFNYDFHRTMRRRKFNAAVKSFRKPFLVGSAIDNPPSRILYLSTSPRKIVMAVPRQPRFAHNDFILLRVSISPPPPCPSPAALLTHDCHSSPLRDYGTEHLKDLSNCSCSPPI